MPGKRIAIAFEFGTLNGGENSMLAVLDRLAGQSPFEFVALAPRAGRLAEALRERGIEHLPLELHDSDGRRLPRAEALQKLAEAIREAAADLVHANSLSMGRLTGALAGDLNVPTIAHLRDILRLSAAAVTDLNRNRLLLAVSDATKQFHAAQGVDADRMRVVHNGVDCDRFRPRPASGVLRRVGFQPAGGVSSSESGRLEAYPTGEAFLVATIGQIGLRKGQDVLAEAAVLAAERLPTAHYLLVGERLSAKQESIDFERKIITRFADAGLRDRLHLLGYRSDVDRLLNEIDLLVHPAHQEPLGRVLLEAAASGVPIIATNVGGTPEILRDGESARLVPPGDPPALAEALVEMVADSETRTRIAASARKRIECTFDIDRATNEAAGVWNELNRPRSGDRGYDG